MKKRVIGLTLAVMLIFSCIFTMTSCLSTFSDILTDSYEDESDAEKKPSGGSNTNAPGGGGGSGNVDVGGSENGGESEGAKEEIEFYPEGGGAVDTELVGAKKAFFSIVSIVTTFEVSYGRTEGKVGSGVIYKLDKETGDAYVITNYHVVYNRYAITRGGISDNISLYLYGMENSSYAIKASFVGGSMTQDIALLKVEGSEILKESYAREADIGDSDSISVMDKVIAIGNPEGYGISVTEGIVSVDSESLDMTGADGQTQLSLRVIRIDAAVNEGNSGGGLFDENGDLIGIVNAKRTGSDVDNIAYAIPTAFAINFVENILYYCDGVETFNPYKCLMGVTVTAKVMGVTVDKDGELIKKEIVEVAELTATSIVKDKILVGDRLLSITVDGEKREITRIHHLIDHMLKARVDSEIVLEVERGEEKLNVSFSVPEAALSRVD